MVETKRYEADAVVVGAGLAGIVTALGLLERGKSVVMLDRLPRARLGGLARWSFGGVFFVGSKEQKRTGVHDTPELALADWLRYGEISEDDIWPRRWAEAMVYQSLERIRGYCVDRDVKFFPAVNWTERGYYVPGNTVPRFHIALGTGEGIVDPLVARLLAPRFNQRLTLGFEHDVTGLDKTNGRFDGVHGVTKDGRDFEAKGESIILAAGGIAGNLDLVREVWPRESLGEPPEILLNGSMPEANGDVMKIAEAEGAKLTHLSNMWNYAAGVRHWRPNHELHGLSIVPGKSALWADYRGKRFEDPPLVGSYDTLFLIEQICKSEKKYSWQIMNRTIAEKEFAVSGAEFNHAMREKKILKFVSTILMGNSALVDEFCANCPDFIVADSVEGLAQKMNALAESDDVDAATLRAEIERYDDIVRRPTATQNDDQIRRIQHVRQWRGDKLRTCNMQPILDSDAMPLIAIRMQMVTRKSLGGIQTDLHGRVLRGDGEPLPGLYAAGEAAGFGGGGIHGKRALEGTFLGGCIYSGQVVAEAITSGRGADGSQ